jgi:hypothetical protein
VPTTPELVPPTSPTATTKRKFKGLVSRESDELPWRVSKKGDL